MDDEELDFDPKKQAAKKPAPSKPKFNMAEDDVSDEYITSEDETQPGGKKKNLWYGSARELLHDQYGGPRITFN